MEPSSPAPRPAATGASEALLVHGRFLRELSRALVPDAERAEDLVQDTWVAALEHPPRHGGAPRAWLAQILRRLAIKKGRRESERGAREEAFARAAAREAAAPDALAAELEFAQRLLRSVERLRDPYRNTLYLRFYRDLSPQAIATAEGVPVKTVKTRLARGLELLREDLDRHHAGRREAWVALLLPLARNAQPVPWVEPAPQSFATALGPALTAGAWVLAAVAVGGTLYFLREAGTRPSAAPAPSPVIASVPETLVSAESPPGRSAVEPVGVKEARAETRVHLKGRVLDWDGEPVSSVEIHAVVHEGVPRSPFSGRGPGGAEPVRDERPIAEARVESNGQGEFELELARPGPVRLTMERDGLAPIGKRLLVFAGQDLDLGEITLEPGVFLAGVVLDEHGSPIAGAELYQERQDEGLTFGPSTTLDLVAHSDERGRFALARQSVGPWRLQARSGSRVPAGAAGTTARSGERVEELELALAAGAAIRGRIVGLDAASASKAIVLARPVGGEGDVSLEPRQRSARPDERGAFELDGLAPADALELVAVLVDGTDRQGRSAPQRARAGDDGVELFVEAGAAPAPGAAHERRNDFAGFEEGPCAIEVLVRHPDGSPAAGALVARRSEDGANRRRSAIDDIRAADREGRLRWSDLLATTHAFRVVSGTFGLFGSRQRQDEGWQTITLEVGVDRRLELASAPASALTGLARVSGQPLASARILLKPTPEGTGGFEGPALSARSDAGGRFRFDDLAPGDYRLELFHPARPLPEARTLVLAPGSSDLVFDLAEASLSGVVRDRTGRALGGAEVRVLPEDPAQERVAPEPPGPATRGVVCDPAGRFAIPGLEPGRRVRLEVSATGCATRRIGPLQPGTTSEIEVALEPEAELALELVSDARPFVVLHAEGPDDAYRSFRVTSGNRTLIHGLAAGTWHLELRDRARRGPHPDGPLAEHTIELVLGRTIELRWVVP